MTIIEDVNNKLNFHTIKNKYFEKQGIEVLRYGLPVGDYILGTEKVMDVIARKKVRGIQPKKMDFLGSYKVCVDSKKDCTELLNNVCGKSHERFRDECILAQNNGIRLIILVENKGGEIGKTGIFNPTIKKLSDLSKWRNPRLFIRKNGKQLYPKATKGVTLMKACYTMQAKYGIEILFCTPEESGKVILDLLGGE